MRTGVSLAIISLNEARNIERCIGSCRDLVDEVVVVDSGSTDGTQRLAERLGARVVHHPFDAFGAQKNRAVDLCTGDWVLNLDADEWLSDELREEMIAAVGSAPADCAGWEFPRHNSICGRWPRFGGWRERRKFRLWRRGCVRWAGSVHEWGEVLGPFRARRLRGALMHDMGDSWERFVRTQRSYADLQAAQMHARGRRAGAFSAAVHSAWAFVRSAALQLGVLEGAFGIRTASARAAYAHRKWSRLRELGRGPRGGAAVGTAIVLALLPQTGRAADAAARHEGGAVSVVRTCGSATSTRNLLPNSSGFPDAPWRFRSAGNASAPAIVQRGVEAPDGTATAVTLRFEAGSSPSVRDESLLEAGVPVRPGQPFTFAFSARGEQGTVIRCRGVSEQRYTRIECNGQWQRVSITEPAGPNRRATVSIGLGSGPGDDPPPSRAIVSLWGPQVQFGRSATAYLPTGPGAEDRDLASARALHPMHFLRDGEPRPACGTAGTESVATNLLRWSLAFRRSPWTLEGIERIDVGAMVSPVGIIGADRLHEDASTGMHGARQAFDCDGDGDYVASVFVRAGGRTRCLLALGVPGDRTEAEIDLAKGTAARTGGSGTVGCEPIGDGWFRASVSARSRGAGAGEFRIAMQAAEGGPAGYKGDGKSGLGAWGAQVEAGSAPTSLIPTFYVPETRAAGLPGPASR